MVESFELGILQQLRAAGLPATYVFLLETKGAPADEFDRSAEGPRSFAWYRTDEGLDSLVSRVDGISVAKRDLFDTNGLGYARGMNDLVERAHDRGLTAYTWTLRPENFFLNLRHQQSISPRGWGDWQAEFAAILSTGVDGIFVDHPDLGVEARDDFARA